MDQCPKCQSGRLVTGKITASEGPVIFRPDSLRFWTLTFLGGTQLSGDACACLECGLVWCCTSVMELNDLVAKHCKQPKPEP
jgi:hypothetical protein